MSDKLFDILNKIQRWLPCLAMFYVALAEVWGWSYADEVNKTICCIATLLASTLEICTSQYHKTNSSTEVE